MENNHSFFIYYIHRLMDKNLGQSKNVPDEVKTLLENLDYEAAKPVIEFYLKQDESNIPLLEAYSEVLLQLDKVADAEKV